MAKSSVDTNPPTANRNITAGGSDWLWVVFAIMLVSDAGMVAWSFLVRQGSIISPTVPTNGRPRRGLGERASFTRWRLSS